MQKSGIPKMRHYAGFLQIGSHIAICIIHLDFYSINQFTSYDNGNAIV